MKISCWAATALAAPAIVTGVCIASAATAHAAPDETAASAGVDSAKSRDTAESTNSSSPQADDTTSESAQSDADADVSDIDAESAVSNADDDEPVPDVDESDADEDVDDTDDAAPTTVPASARANSAQDLVTVETQAVDDSEGTDTVDLALEQITEARTDLNEATWDSGNILAGLAAILPQMWLGGAHTSLERWQDNYALLQQQFAATVDNPFAHWIAGQRIEASIMRTVRVQDQLEAAEKWLGLVGLFGPRESMAEIAKLIDEASDNGLVYQILDLDMQEVDGVRRVNPVFKLSVNGGKFVNVLLDTGSLGLVINPQVIGLENLGKPVAHGSSCYGNCSLKYEYDTYNIPIAVDDDVVTAPTGINVVTLDTWYALSTTNGDYQGILGIGAKAGGGPSNPLLALPGLLGMGALIEERRGRAILGPNPYAARVTLDGAPSNNLTVKVGDNDAKVLQTWIDSGGIFGWVPRSLTNGADSVPAGTKISVYTEDGETLLFDYTTTRTNTPSVVEDAAVPVLMGFPAFAAASIYVAFIGEGQTIFNYA
ncbi:Conserved protein of uncharacterised function, PE-PGRS family protein (part2) [Mycolicibacterium aurum]|uniref:Conserved protein of uncharacterized function, PE-PGRS family protein (Part2) n=1 Tax=Mycolicibacterium aurum TaxID=1791 RepID=A0A3S5EJ23_MYCAU|nr:PecA family PE domain-processing aspartic protease [Mycolicibacterium aurum]VEG52372.1 Conserved protein of uncharacterised function, PE-PGRS family protein (part2) [Mycolicibacterium aurum]